MLRAVYAVMIFLLLGSAVMGVPGCAHVDGQSQSQEVNAAPHPLEVKAFFVAGKEAHYLALQCPTSGSVDLSAYSHLMEIKYPPTLQVDVLGKAPARSYKSFAVLECQPAPHAKPGEMVERLKGKAREIGADAIILCQAGPGQGLPELPPTAKLQAVAIKYVITTDVK
jgi:hypothetical protein